MSNITLDVVAGHSRGHVCQAENCDLTFASLDDLYEHTAFHHIQDANLVNEDDDDIDLVFKPGKNHSSSGTFGPGHLILKSYFRHFFLNLYLKDNLCIITRIITSCSRKQKR